MTGLMDSMALDPLTLLSGLGPIWGEVECETWPLWRPFAIARGVQTDIALVKVTLRDREGRIGRGESCPVAHHGETPEGVVAMIGDMLARLEGGMDWSELHDRVPAGAARNAVDCAMWDLAAKARRRRVSDMLGMSVPKPVETVFTIGLGTPELMARQALETEGHARLKLKLGAEGDTDRLRAIRAAVPDKILIADVNEHWSSRQLMANLPVVIACRIAMLEQPLPAGGDAGLAAFDHPVPIGADESCHVAADIVTVAQRYDLVNIKLDKTGGLTEALRLLHAARRAGLDIMVGCMLGTSLAMAPAMLIAQFCTHVDLDAPLLIGGDRSPALDYRNGWIAPPCADLWG